MPQGCSWEACANIWWPWRGSSGREVSRLVPHCHSLVQEAEEQHQESQLVEDEEQQLSLGSLKSFHSSVGGSAMVCTAQADS